MASFTDNLQYSTSFTPYVQQLPVDAMRDVGVYKQTQYDQGVQRIQSSIDRVAGLSVMRDVDKQYLKSKMSQLGNNLRMVSMGDFSNYQLVNSVGGMVNQIGKDKYVQTAVNSTARIQKELETIDKLKKEGKSDKNNEDYFYEKMLSPYLNAGLKDASGKPVSFNGSFSPYVDITDEVRKLAKDAGLDEDVVQMMYETDINGKIKFDEHGRAIPARTMTEITESSNAKAIEGILNTVLNRGDIQNQMGIDAWANTRGVDPTKLLVGYEQQFNEKFSYIDEETVRLKTLLNGSLPKEQEAVLNDQLKKLADQKIKYEKQANDLKQLAQLDPQAFKERIYKTNYENSLKDIFIKTKRQEKNLESPLTKQLNWEKDFDLSYGSEMFDRQIALREQKRKDEEFELNFPIDPATGLRYKADGKTKPPSEDLRLPAQASGTGDKTATQMFEEERTKNLMDRSYDTGFHLMYDLYKRNGAFPVAKNEKGFQYYIEKQAEKENMTPRQYVAKWVANLDNNAKLIGATLGNSDKQLMTSFNNDNSAYLQQQAIITVVNKDVKDKTGTNVAAYMDILKPASITLANGTTIGFTKQDMLDYALYDVDPGVKRRVDSKYPSGGGLSSKETLLYTMMDVLQKKYGQYGTLKGSYYSNDWRESPEWLSLQKVVNSDLSNFRKAAELKEEIYRKFTADEENITFPGGETDAEGKAAKARVLALVNSNEQLAGVRFDRGKIQKALTDTDSKITFIGNAPYVEGMPWKGEVIVTNKDGLDMHINIDTKEALEGLSDKKFSDFKFNTYKALALTSESHSTNLGAYTTNKDAYQTAAIKDNIFYSLKKSDKYIPLGADLNLMPDEKSWTFTIYLKDKKTGEILKPIESDRTFLVGTESLIINGLPNLTESQIDEIIRNKQK